MHHSPAVTPRLVQNLHDKRTNCQFLLMLRLSDLLQMNGLIMNMSPVCEQSLKAFLSDQMTDERVC